MRGSTLKQITNSAFLKTSVSTDIKIMLKTKKVENELFCFLSVTIGIDGGRSGM